jgi:chemotaxis protein histidine kinase CheA
MKSLLLPALALVFVLVSCEKAAPPPVAELPAAAPVDDSALREARDALARQAMEVETRSALLDKQLADLEARLQQSENEALRGQLEGLRQQNDQLRTQADTARKKSDTLTKRLAASTPAAAAPLAAPAAPRDYAVFYERLAPHGRWIDVSGHGLCFQPRLARNRTWRPYVDGCWGWSSLGWTWQTSEPFGWATYHYGRWLNLTSHGWLWVPGCEWAPAWVAWRQSRDHIGWAPLPPESGPCAPVRRDCDTRYNLGPASYTFVRTTHFVRPSYSTCIQPVSYNSTLFHHTVNITQIVPCGGGKPGGTPLYMHHGGPPRHQIEETCRQPVPQPQIRPVELAQMAIKPITIQPSQGSAPVLEIVQLPAATQNRLPDLRPAERIENPILANPYAGVPASARPAIQQTLAAEVRQVVLADSPRPMAVNATPEAPATPPENTPSTTEPTTSPTEPIPALTANLSAPIENRGTQPQITSPTLPPVPPEQPALVVSSTPASSERSIGSLESAPPSPPTATLPPAEIPSATPEPATVPVIPPAADEAIRAAAEQQAQMASAQQQQVEEAARRAAEEETARQAQMQAQTQAAETQRQAQEQAQQQALMEAARLAQEEAQMAAQRQAEETARQQAEAAAMAQRQAAEEAQRQAQMEAQRQAEEAARRAAEEAQRQAQMEAQRQAEEAARRAAEEAQRQAQMEAQRQAEEAARRAAEEAQRQAQMEAQRQADEAARRAAEEAQRQAAEEAARQAAAAAAQQPSPPPQ